MPLRWPFMNRNVGAGHRPRPPRYEIAGRRSGLPLQARDIRHMIPRRPAESQKGKNGHLLIVAGSEGMTGAAYLCAMGALKTGAGLVTVCGPQAVRKIIAVCLPEAMTVSTKNLRGYLRRRKITTLGVGPGLGVGAAQKKLITELIRAKLPMVLDADGLNNSRPADVKNKSVIITPHPGELAKFLGQSIARIQSDRSGVACDTARRLGIVCVLKGHRTVISDGRNTFINPTGNQAMATGGMGDILTGMIAALLAQGLSLFDAACAGVYLHGLAGDLARISDRGLLASDVSFYVPRALRKIGIR
jgi:hydroxyethylthiazole kinase-like uncharacterized protein yjeF